MGRLVLVASVLFAGCAAVPLSGFDGGEEPRLQEAAEPSVPSGPGRFLPSYYRGESQRCVEVGLQIVFPGTEKMDPNDPDGWILRSALNHWSERAIKAEANIKRAERLLETIGCDCENHGDFDCNQCQREAQLKGTGDD